MENLKERRPDWASTNPSEALNGARFQVNKALEVLTSKGAPVEGTAAGHLAHALTGIINALASLLPHYPDDDR